MCSLILEPTFQLKSVRKYSMVMRRIVTKLIVRVGSQKVKQATAKEHLPLVLYVERCRRKRQNMKERAKLLALMGQKAPLDGEAGDQDDDSDSDSSDGGENEKDAQMASQSEGDSDQSDSEDDEANLRGMDQFKSSSRFDIPIVKDIPILSQLARQEKQDQKPKPKAHEIMEVDELDVDTHFVDNPFIRTRERAHKKMLD